MSDQRRDRVTGSPGTDSNRNKDFSTNPTPKPKEKDNRRKVPTNSTGPKRDN